MLTAITAQDTTTTEEKKQTQNKEINVSWRDTTTVIINTTREHCLICLFVIDQKKLLTFNAVYAITIFAIIITTIITIIITITIAFITPCVCKPGGCW